MESNKFDNSIKETLENRRLQPSNDAWNKLSQRLENQNKKQTNKSIWFIGVAASLVGLLFVVFQFFNTKEITPTITEMPTVKQQEKTPIASGNAEATNTVLEESHPIKTIKKQQIKDNITSVAKKQMLEKENNHLAEVNTNESLETQKIETILAQVNNLKNNNQTVTDAYIETLLRQAQKEIRLQKLYNQKTGIVDASLLLEQVETDLDQSFRSKVFEAIKASYTTVRTVVAQRND